MRRVLFAALLFSACPTDPLDLDIPANSDQWEDEDFVAAGKALSEEDRKLLMRYLFTAELRRANGEPIPDVTIGEALEIQRKKEAIQAEKEAKREAELKAKRRNQELDKSIRDTLSVEVAGVGFWSKTPEREACFPLNLAFTNTGSQGIQSVTVELGFLDTAVKREVKRFELAFDKPIPAGQTVTWEGTMPFADLDDDKQLRAAFLTGIRERVRIRWEPRSVVYDTGTKVTLTK